MKNLFVKFAASLALACPAISAQADYAADPRFPTFHRHGIKFQCTIQPEFGTVTLLFWNGNAWVSWGGPADTNGEVATSYSDAAIMAHGSLRGFLEWVATECERRADVFAALPLPDPNNRSERFNYAMKMLMKVQTVDGVEYIIVPPSPLP